MKTFDQVMDACRELAYQVESSGEHLDGLVGVARGGLTPAHWLAQLLHVHRVTAIDVGFVDVGRTRMEYWSCPAFAAPQPRRLLVVEDVVDTGRLLMEAVSLLDPGRLLVEVAALLDPDNGWREVRTAALWQTTRSPVRVDYVAATVDEIPRMPWEESRGKH